MTKKIAAICTTTFDAEYKDKLAMPGECIENLLTHSDPSLTDVILIDNGSDFELPDFGATKLIRLEENHGINHVFHNTLSQLQEYDIIAHFHMDFMMQQEGWDHKVYQAFIDDLDLALAGYVGSYEIDGAGGRGLGTHTCFVGNKYRSGQGSVAKIHGATTTRITPAAVLDHCSMIFRRTCLEELSSVEKTNIAPHHFGDRIWCCEILQKGWHIVILDGKCDHFGGATGYGRKSYDRMGIRWLERKGYSYDESLVDQFVYKYAEKIFLRKWRDVLHFIPLKVNSNFSIKHRG